jgi:hypothetical protein
LAHSVARLGLTPPAALLPPDPRAEQPRRSVMDRLAVRA